MYRHGINISTRYVLFTPQDPAPREARLRLCAAEVAQIPEIAQVPAK
jgi:hypothetical protein